MEQTETRERRGRSHERGGVLKWLARKRYQFEILSSMTMWEEREVQIVYIILFAVLLMVLYTTVVYLPSHAMHIVNMLWEQ